MWIEYLIVAGDNGWRDCDELIRGQKDEANDGEFD
jgi:hypothetical protein